jgi:hypothetical protein
MRHAQSHHSNAVHPQRQALRVAHPSRRGDVADGMLSYLRNSTVVSFLTIPVIYLLVVPLVFLDLCVTIYQAICFPLLGIDTVSRGSHFVIDRHRLAYLNLIEKGHCLYCSYANGVLAFVREVLGRTETYWCPIKHSRAVPDAHNYYREFFDYGDGSAYHDGLTGIRATLTSPRRAPRHK